MFDATLARKREIAGGVMTENPISIHEHITLKEAAAFLTDRGISAAPVINDAGRPVGVLSRTDIVQFSSGAAEAPQTLGEFVNEGLDTGNRPLSQSVLVRQLMTPEVLSVDLDTHLAQVIETMLIGKMHQLFVIDNDLVLVGVISSLDIFRCLVR